MSTLKHLALCPRGGLGNRLRAIASARRIGELFQVRCTVVWAWGNYDELFLPAAGTDWIPALTSEMKRWPCVSHLLTRDGGNEQNRRVSLSLGENVVVCSHYPFNATEEPGFIDETQVQPWLPQPAEVIRAKVRDFKEAHLHNAVGIHMRRADNKKAKRGTPEALYFAEAERALGLGYRIFLATDKEQTAALMKERYGDRLITYPKTSNLKRRWPRPFRLVDTIDDIVDLHLLAACQFVIGSRYSSFSRLAALYNGSPLCSMLPCEPTASALPPAS